MAAGRCLLATYVAFSSPGSSLAAVLRGPDSSDHVEAFHAYMQKHNRQYRHGSDEYRQRLALFQRATSEVEAHNSKSDRLWDAAVNALADRTEEELKRLRGWKGGATPTARGAGLLEQNGTTQLRGKKVPAALPEEHLEWGNLKAAKPYDQGGCGSCWAVTSSEVLQMHMEIHNPNSSRTFSVQELVSCVPNPLECGGQGGCSGATVELAYNWAVLMGLSQETDTPYRGVDSSCKKQVPSSHGLMQLSGYNNIEEVSSVGVHEAPKNSPSHAFGMTGYERLAENGYEQLLRAVVEQGPVGISVAARPWSFYSKGVFDGCNNEWIIDHAVALIGYGKDKKVQKGYYLVQNSWGPDWGENGRIRILRREDDGERCGMDTQPQLGTGCKGGPKEVRVCGPCGILYDSVVPHVKHVPSA